MENFFNFLARGARSLSFERRRTVLDFDNKPLKFSLNRSRPRTPNEIMRSAWEDVGNRMWEAVGVVKKEYGDQLAK